VEVTAVAAAPASSAAPQPQQAAAALAQMARHLGRWVLHRALTRCHTHTLHHDGLFCCLGRVHASERWLSHAHAAQAVALDVITVTTLALAAAAVAAAPQWGAGTVGALLTLCLHATGYLTACPTACAATARARHALRSPPPS